MSPEEYGLTGCENRHARFYFDGGVEKTGVATTFFIEEPNRYYLVETAKLQQFRKYSDVHDVEKMKSLCQELDFNTLKEVELFDPINISYRAQLILQKLPINVQSSITTLLSSINNDLRLLDRSEVLTVGGSQVFVYRLDQFTRLLIHKKRKGIILLNILFGRH